MLLVLYIPACGHDGSVKLSNVAKNDVDMIIDIHLREISSLVAELTEKLYLRNPAELAKALNGPVSIHDRVRAVTDCRSHRPLQETQGKTGIDAMLLGFEESYAGDRVFAMMTGLYTMIIAAYNGRCESFMIHQLDQQKLHNSARNIEILVWRLKNRRQADGRLFLLTNETDQPLKNLSFERLFGKMIATQDMMALIVSEKTQRLIINAVHMAGMAFLPI
jgi:hypothetical protein